MEERNAPIDMIVEFKAMKFPYPDLSPGDDQRSWGKGFLSNTMSRVQSVVQERTSSFSAAIAKTAMSVDGQQVRFSSRCLVDMTGGY